MKTHLGKARILLLIIFLLGGKEAAGLDLNFRYYQVEDGLSSNTVHSIIQDATGYIWIATEDGLNRFDGYEFRPFRNVPRDTTSIINNYVYALMEDTDGKIWVGTEEGICTYDPLTQVFYPFRAATREGIRLNERIQHILSDNGGDVWFSSYWQGVFVYHKEEKTLHKYNLDAYRRNVHEPLSVTCLYMDKQEDIWVSANNTLHTIYRLNRKADRFEPAFPDTPSGVLDQLASHAILEDMFGALWFGTWTNGLYALSRNGKLLGRYLYRENEDKVLHIHSLAEYEAGKLLIGSNDGLTSLTGSPTRGYKRDAHVREPVLSNCFVYPIFKDREGGLWIGTYYGGISYASPNRNYFTGYVHDKYENSVSGNVISAFCEDAEGNLWIGTDDAGLNHFNVRTGHFTAYKPERNRNSISFHNIHALCIDNDQLWIGTYTGGLNVMDMRTRRFRHYQANPADTASLASNSIYSLYKDTQGNIWVGTMMGIDLYDRSTDSFRRMIHHDKTTSDILQVGDVIWFAVIGDGLYSYNLKTNRWKHYLYEDDNLSSLISNNVICLCEDEQGTLWIGTNNGLCRFDTHAESFIRVPVAFESNSICTIFTDNGRLWLTTSRGLIEYDPRTNRYRLFTREDGLTSEQFTAKSGIKTTAGKIYAGTTNGFNSFYPRQIVVNRHIPPVALSNFELFNQPEPMNRYLSLRYTDMPTIVLPYNKNSFAFEYTALSYFAPGKNEYAFYLEEFDKQWNYVGRKRKAAYTNILPGEYIFRVKATNNDGVWNEQGTALRIVITPPIWLTKGFLVVYVFLFILMLMGLYMYIIKRIERRNNRRIEKFRNEQEKEAYHSKINFFTSIAHEIRTPVSLIIGPLEKIIGESGQLPAKVREDLTVIDRNSKRLLLLINQLLDFRKIEKETIRISLAEQNIHELLLNVYDRFKPYVENKDIKFVYECDNQNFTAFADTENLTKVISNLLNNASKFTTDYIELLLTTETTDGMYRISVRDNGGGIPAERQHDIFKAFYQLPGTRQRGTGLGLYLVKSIVDACQGTIRVDSRPGGGTTFTVTLPTGNSGQEVARSEREPASEKIYREEYAVSRQTEPAPGSTLPGRTILIVEDNTEMIEFLRNSFLTGYSVLLAGNGREGLEVLENNEVDLIVSDIMMPEMDGIEFCKKVKESFLWNHIPFILLTARTNVTAKIEALEVGADAYLEKPFSVAHLVAQVKNLLGTREKLLRKFTESPYASLKSIAGNKADERFLARVNKIIERNISNMDFTMEQLADELRISYSGLFTKIKSLAGVTPNKLLMLVRLKKAAEMLVENKYRIAEIGYRVGFNSPSYFTKCFQKQFGVKPGDYTKKEVSEEEGV